MYITYIDESKDPITNTFIFSAAMIEDDQWLNVYKALLDYRRLLKRTDNIYVRKELHAWKFTSGRGQICPPPHFVSKHRRIEIFSEYLTMASTLPGTLLLNSVNSNIDWALERLLNRINRTAQQHQTYAVLIFDEGEEGAITRMIRRMRQFNYIPSRFGAWSPGVAAKNIPLGCIVEDPFFRDSKASYFIQLVDFCAYALMQKERPMPAKVLLGLDKTFELLEPICFKAAHRRDPYGIIR